MSKEILIPKQKPFISVESKSYYNGKYEAKMCLYFATKNDDDIGYIVKLDYNIKGTRAEDEVILDISVVAELTKPEADTEEQKTETETELKATTEKQDAKTEKFQAKWSVYLKSHLKPFNKEYGYSFVPSKAEIEHTNFGKRQEWLNERILSFPTTIVAPIKFEYLKIPTFTYQLSYDEDENEFASVFK